MLNMEPTFPLPRHASPACKRCGLRCVRQTWAITNRNGNAGRPFYTCLGSQARPHRREFSCWDDYRGITIGRNPKCECGFTSRLSTIDGNDVFFCPVGACRWSQNAPSGFGQQLPNNFGPVVIATPGPVYQENNHSCCVIM